MSVGAIAPYLGLFLQGEGQGWLPIVMGISVLSLGVAGWLTAYVLKQETGTPRMQEISNAIKEGAEAFLKRQYMTITALTGVLAVVIRSEERRVGKECRL